MKASKKRWLAILMILAMAFTLAACGGGEAEAPEAPEAEGPAEIQGKIILATTTSTKDSGLLDYILPEFTYQTGWEVDVISVGSGEAMAMGEAGEADVLLVHSPKDEAAFVENGHADADGRFDVMYNDFVIVGAADDPAGVKAAAASDAIAAFTAIMERKQPLSPGATTPAPTKRRWTPGRTRASARPATGTWSPRPS